MTYLGLSRYGNIKLGPDHAQPDFSYVSSIEISQDDRIRFEVDLGEDLNFVYEVRLRAYIQPAFALAGLQDEDRDEEHKYYRGEVHLKEGGQDYDVMSWTQEQIIHDILDQYEKHLHFLHLVR